jgi:hypothetical protein
MFLFSLSWNEFELSEGLSSQTSIRPSSLLYFYNANTISFLVLYSVWF